MDKKKRTQKRGDIYQDRRTDIRPRNLHSTPKKKRDKRGPKRQEGETQCKTKHVSTGCSLKIKSNERGPVVF